jgi:hypothetical protein
MRWQSRFNVGAFFLYASREFSAVIPMSLYGGRFYELKKRLFASSLGDAAQVAGVY